ncbi:MAG: transglutaminase-like domain-containing protein [Nanoarchaeota archaeon]
MIKRLVILFLLLMPLAMASEFNDKAVVELSVEETASVVAVSQHAGPARIDYVLANLSMFPRESGNQILAERTVSTLPKADVQFIGDKLLIRWEDPRDEMLKFVINAKVREINNLVTVPIKLAFPHPEPYRAAAYDRDIDEYTKATEFVDITDEIKQKSADILEGETDYYRATFKIADWVNENINYSLDTLTEDAVQKASWVFENKYGVCDEITVLFMSMLRSVNIPVRFVAGQVYSGKDESFGNHGWAEVYFPGYGWVPFDVTFKQFGWIDPTHLKLAVEYDPSESSVGYSWKTSDTKININPLVINTRIVSASGSAEKLADINVEALRTRVSNGSYVPFKVTVKNLQDYYLPLLVSITKAPNLLDETEKPVLLAPHEEKTIFRTAVMPSDIMKNYAYTTFIEAKAVFAGTAGTNISFGGGNEYFSKEWALDTVQRLSPRSEKEFLPDLEISCIPLKEYYYRTETAQVKCSLENKGNTNFRPMKVCFEAQCKDADMLIGEKKEVDWQIKLKEIKSSDFMFSVESRDMVRYAYPKLNIIEVPLLEISEFKPSEIKYNVDSNLSFILNGNGEARDITMDVKNVGNSQISTFPGVHEILIPFNSKQVRKGNVVITLIYYDKVGKMYSFDKEFSILVTDIPWYTRLAMWIEELMPFVEF